MLAILAVPAGDYLAGARQNVIGSTGCKVASITDGDTVRLLCRGPRVVPARIRGYDTPEVFSPKCTSEALRGTAATFRLRAILWSADTLTMDAYGEDRYGRLLIDMRADGRKVSSLMIETGLARPYDGGQRQGWCN